MAICGTRILHAYCAIFLFQMSCLWSLLRLEVGHLKQVSINGRCSSYQL